MFLFIWNNVYSNIHIIFRGVNSFFHTVSKAHVLWNNYSQHSTNIEEIVWFSMSENLYIAEQLHVQFHWTIVCNLFVCELPTPSSRGINSHCRGISSHNHPWEPKQPELIWWPSQLVIQSSRFIFVFPACRHSTVITCGNFGEFFSMPKIVSSQKTGWGHANLIPFYCCCQGIIIQSNSIRRSSTLFTNIFHWETEWEITMTLNNLMEADKVVDVSFCKAYLVVFLYWLQSWAPGTRCQGHVWHQAVLLV